MALFCVRRPIAISEVRRANPKVSTQKSAIGAYTQMRPRWKFLGILTFLVPVLIMTYYAVIGGWITKYAVVYITGQAQAAAADDYFTAFITSFTSPVIFALVQGR